MEPQIPPISQILRRLLGDDRTSLFAAKFRGIANRNLLYLRNLRLNPFRFLPGARTFLGFVTTGNFACDHRWAQLAFSQVVGGIDIIVIQEGKEMVALFIKATAYGQSPDSIRARLRRLKRFCDLIDQTKGLECLKSKTGCR